jgi:hypothetical protein
MMKPHLERHEHITTALDLLKQHTVTAYVNWIIDLHSTVGLEFITHYQNNCVDPQMLQDPITSYTFSTADHRVILNVNTITLVRKHDQLLIQIATESVVQIKAIEYPEISPLVYDMTELGNNSTDIARQIRLEQRAEQLERQRLEQKAVHQAVLKTTINGVTDLTSFRRQRTTVSQ